MINILTENGQYFYYARKKPMDLSLNRGSIEKEIDMQKQYEDSIDRFNRKLDKLYKEKEALRHLQMKGGNPDFAEIDSKIKTIESKAINAASKLNYNEPTKKVRKKVRFRVLRSFKVLKVSNGFMKFSDLPKGLQPNVKDIRFQVIIDIL